MYLMYVNFTQYYINLKKSDGKNKINVAVSLNSIYSLSPMASVTRHRIHVKFISTKLFWTLVYRYIISSGFFPTIYI